MTRPGIPSILRALGYAGLVPQAAAALVIVIGPADYRIGAMALALAYAALIFSFLGGLWWGLAAAQLQDAPVWVWPIGVLPSLLSLAIGISWAAGIAQLPALLAILAAGIAGSVLVDLQFYRLAMCPRDWFSFRLQLSLSLAALAAVCGTG